MIDDAWFRSTGCWVTSGRRFRRVDSDWGGQRCAWTSHDSATDFQHSQLNPVAVLTCVSLVYGALLGFTIVVAWEQFSSADTNVAAEASTVTTMYRQTVAIEFVVAFAASWWFFDPKQRKARAKRKETQRISEQQYSQQMIAKLVVTLRCGHISARCRE